MSAQPQKATVAEEFPADLPGMLIRGEVTLARIFGLDRESLYSIALVGYGLLNSGNLRDAKRIYSGLVAADPYDSVFNCHLAAVHHRMGELDDALVHYSAALNLNSANVDALVGRGEIFLSRGKLVQGITDLRQAIELDPECLRPATARAHTLLLALKPRSLK